MDLKSTLLDIAKTSDPRYLEKIDLWPVIEADDLVKCADCSHIGKSHMREIVEPHGEVILEPRCEACLAPYVYRWPQD